MKDLILSILIYTTFYTIGQSISDSFIFGWFCLLGANLVIAIVGIGLGQSKK